MTLEIHNKPIQKKRYAILAVGMLALVAADFLLAPTTDPYASRGNGYAHRTPGIGSEKPDYNALRGYRRVVFNFRHWLYWWTPKASASGSGLRSFLASDGNSALHNLIGHFCISFLLTLLAIWYVPRAWLVIAFGTFMNVFHEYIAEGQYVDPSFVDLWLDQLGLFLATVMFLCIRRSILGRPLGQPNDAVNTGKPSSNHGMSADQEGPRPFRSRPSLASYPRRQKDD